MGGFDRLSKGLVFALAPAVAEEAPHAQPATEPRTESEFTRLYKANAGPILGYLIAVTGRRETAEDLLQESVP